MKRILVLLSFIISYLMSEDISELLQKLNNKEELYHKTKVESAGMLIVYTRDDLDKMQAYTLKDILKSLRFFTLKEGYGGEISLMPSGGKSVLSSMFRLYIDGHEVSSSIYGSSMLQFADMDLSFVNHIEIYEGGNAIAFGDEPGLVTIRIYSKDPKKESGNTLSILGDNRGSVNGRICYTKTYSNSSLLLYLQGKKEIRKKVHYDKNSYSKDFNQNSFYARYILDGKGAISVGNFFKEKDAFVGVGFNQTPIEPNRVKQNHFLVNLEHKVPYNFSMNLSIDKIDHRMLFSDKNGIVIAQRPHAPFLHFDGKFGEMIYKATLKQKIKFENSNFKWGIEGIQKKYKINHMLLGSENYSKIVGPSRIDILSLYAEESYNIDENNLLIATLKSDNYSDNYNNNNREFITRVGYIHLFSKSLSAKIFASKLYLYPGFAYTTTFPNNLLGNPFLKPEHYRFVVGSVKYERDGDMLSTGGAYLISKDKITYDEKRKFINSKDIYKAMRFYASYTHNFDILNRVTFEIYDTHYISKGIPKVSPTYGGLIRFLNSYERFDFFNELIYRSGYIYPFPSILGGPMRIKAGYDYNFGVKWHINHAFTLSLKGENLLKRASKSPIYHIGAVDAVDRRVICNLEYFF